MLVEQQDQNNNKSQIENSIALKIWKSFNSRLNMEAFWSIVLLMVIIMELRNRL